MAQAAVEFPKTGLMTPAISRNGSLMMVSSACDTAGVETTLFNALNPPEHLEISKLEHDVGSRGLQMREEFPIRGCKRRRTVSFSHVWDLPTGESPSPEPIKIERLVSLPVSAGSTGVTHQELTVATPPVTPPASFDDPESAALLSRATHVLTTELAALSALTRIYQTDPAARSALIAAVEAIVQAVTGTSSARRKGKLIACAVGKSGFIARKLVAMMTSLGIRSSFMHAAEAVHGDLGDVEAGDVVLFVSFSGKTRELIDVVTHLPDDVTVIALTGWVQKTPEDICPLLQGRRAVGCIPKVADDLVSTQNEAYELGILLTAPIHESEESTFGVCAPTTSTIVAMAVCDMLALTVAERVHGERCAEVFKRNHPGGAIGARLKS